MHRAAYLPACLPACQVRSREWWARLLDLLPGSSRHVPPVSYTWLVRAERKKRAAKGRPAVASAALVACSVFFFLSLLLYSATLLVFAGDQPGTQPLINVAGVVCCFLIPFSPPLFFF